jgi:hypothetical protein
MIHFQVKLIILVILKSFGDNCIDKSVSYTNYVTNTFFVIFLDSTMGISNLRFSYFKYFKVFKEKNITKNPTTYSYYSDINPSNDISKRSCNNIFYSNKNWKLSIVLIIKKKNCFKFYFKFINYKFILIPIYNFNFYFKILNDFLSIFQYKT